MSAIKVAIVGASGETGQSIVSGLLKSSQPYCITALIRPTSLNKPEVHQLTSKGNIAITPFDLEWPHAQQVAALAGQDVVVCCIIPQSAALQIALADAAKEAAVERFVPSAFGPVAPPYGVMALREIKEDVLNHVKAIHLPYTSIDVGWWFQNTLPRLPSGRIDYAVTFPQDVVYAGGRLPTALTDLRDVGLVVARVLADPRTLDASVFVHGEVRTQAQILALLERLAGEEVAMKHRSAEDLQDAIVVAQAQYDADPSWARLLGVALLQYPNSVWVRGDNLPARAKELGYLDAKELYPDLEDQLTRYDDYVAEVVAGNGKAPYANRTFGFEPEA